MNTFAYEYAVLCNKWPFLLHNPFTRASNVGQSVQVWLQSFTIKYLQNLFSLIVIGLKKYF